MRTPSSSPDPDPDDWASALARVQADPTQPRLVFQPIVDLARGVVAGYEALSRFDGLPQASPDRWFDAAERHGCAAALELRAMERALEVRTTLPPDTFLTVNVTPSTMLHPLARGLLDGQRALQRLVFEVTEHARVTDYDELRRAAGRVRAAGGLLAVDDAGAGYASLKHVLELRPDFVKLDRELITGVDTDPTKRSVVHMLGELTDRIDAWVIAEGIETTGELDALLELSVPLGQGWVLGRPAPPWADVAAELAEHLRVRQRELQDEDQLTALIERRSAVPHDASPSAVAEWFARSPGMAVVIQLDAAGHPAGLLRRAEIDAGQYTLHPVLTVAPEASVAHVARRAMHREPGLRFDPVVCRRESGAYAGLVTLERLVEWLARDRGR